MNQPVDIISSPMAMREAADSQTPVCHTRAGGYLIPTYTRIDGPAQRTSRHTAAARRLLSITESVKMSSNINNSITITFNLNKLNNLTFQCPLCNGS